MRIGPRLEATRHLLGELALTLARQPRHHFPKQNRGTTTGLGRRRCEPLLALSSKPTEFLGDRHKQSICPARCGTGSNKDLTACEHGDGGKVLEISVAADPKAPRGAI
jgi:hypothetical protein